MKYSEDIKMEIGGKFINGDYTNNLKLLYKDLNRLTKSVKSEQFSLTDVVSMCCNNPKEKHGHTAMYEHYKYCGNCGKDLL